MTVRRLIARLPALTLMLPVTGCAAHYSAGAVQDPYGFWSGLWHGVVFPLALLANVISWFVSLIGLSFLDAIQIIGRPNTGFWYYVGFVLGLAAIGGRAGG